MPSQRHRPKARPGLLWRLKPKGLTFSFTGVVIALFTVTTAFLAIRFPYRGLIATAVIMLFINSLFFIRFSDRKKKTGWFDRMMQSRFFPRKLAFAAEGKFLVVISIGIGFAAVNTGSNLMYLLMAMLMSIIVASGMLSELSLRKLSWAADLPAEAVARAQTVFPIRITNGKKRLSSFSIDGEVLFHADTEVRQNLGRTLKLDPLASDWLFPTVEFPRRGRYRIRGTAVGTRYPFSFFRKSRNAEQVRDIVVVPAGRSPVPPVLYELARGNEEHADRPGRGTEFFSVRQMYPGDEWRSVHWKQTARTSTFAVKEYEALASRRVYVTLEWDPSAAEDAAPKSSAPPRSAAAGRHADGAKSTGQTRSAATGRHAAGADDWERLEQGIELAASVVRHLADRGFEVGLLGPGLHIRPSGGATAVRQIFLALAEFDLWPLGNAIPPSHPAGSAPNPSPLVGEGRVRGPLAGTADLQILIDLRTHAVTLSGRGIRPGGPA